MHSSKILFQSTFPRGERQQLTFQTDNVGSYFNPRSRVGNDSDCSCTFHLRCISIHVPAWGTTKSGNPHKQRILISIHVPAWGTTYEKLGIIQSKLFQSTFPRGERLSDFEIRIPARKFQSTFPRGERRPYTAFVTSFPNISIHVPAWGTTIYDDSFYCFGCDFNPRSRVGNDRFEYSSTLLTTISIHVPAWGTTVS